MDLARDWPLPGPGRRRLTPTTGDLLSVLDGDVVVCVVEHAGHHDTDPLQLLGEEHDDLADGLWSGAAMERAEKDILQIPEVARCLREKLIGLAACHEP